MAAVKVKVVEIALVLSAMCLCLTSGAVRYWSKSAPMEYGISTPPLITKPERQHQPVFHNGGESFNLSCAAIGSDVVLQWYRNDQPIPTDNTFLEEVAEEGKLLFRDFTKRDEGYFRCMASNQHGVSLSPVVEVRQRTSESFSNVAADQLSLEVYEGAGVALHCHHQPRFNPRGTFSWYYKTNNRQDQIPISKTPRMDMDVNGTLYITTAEFEDKQDTYACAVQSDELSQVNTARVPYIKLSVNQPTSAAQLEPSLLGSTGYVTADKGGEALIECFFSGNATVTWLHGESNKAIVSGRDRRRISASGHQLRISGLMDSDQGRYLCQAKTARGTTYLNVTSRPLFKKESPQVIIAPVGSDATFSCEAEGSFNEQKLPAPYWTSNGQPVPQGDKFSFNGDKTTLTIVNVTKSDLMSVQCNVTNSRGYAFGDGYLTVIEPLVITSVLNETLDVSPGTQWLNLTVTTSSDPCCPANFAWTHNGTTIATPSLHMHPFAYTHTGNRATLSIRLDGPEAEVKKLMGMYRCHVFHGAYAQEAERSVFADVRMKAEVAQQQINSAAVTTSYWWIGVLGGVLVVIIAIVLIACMVRHNYPRQEYLLDKIEKKHRLNPEQDLLDQSFEEI